MAQRGEGEARVFLFCLRAAQGSGTADNRSCIFFGGRGHCYLLVIREEMDKEKASMILLQLANYSGSVFKKWREGAKGKLAYFFFV